MSMAMTDNKNLLSICLSLFVMGCVASWLSLPCYSQEADRQVGVNASIGADGTGSLIVEARGELPEPPVFYKANAVATAQVGAEGVEQVIELTVQVLQGKAKTVSFGLSGQGDVTEVQGEHLQSWSIRRVAETRYIDLHLKEEIQELKCELKLRSSHPHLPAAIELAHLTPGEAVGFDEVVAIHYAAGVEGTITAADGFVPIQVADGPLRYQTSNGGRIAVALDRDATTPEPVELTDVTLIGHADAAGKSVRFEMRSTARVTQPDAQITILSGAAAVSEIPADADYRLRLAPSATGSSGSAYQLVFPKVGTFPVSLEFVAAVTTTEANWSKMDFTVASGAVVPLHLTGLDGELEFHRDQESVVPLREDNAWQGFLPASGLARLQWKTARKTGDGKLFFTSTGHISAQVGAGLLRQDHRIAYQVLQGELPALSLLLRGPGEILDVQGSNIIGWKISGEGDQRRLDVTLSQPMTAASEINVRSQTPLGAFPLRVDGLRLEPVGAIRHSGYLRITNIGSVRLEPTGLVGLTQLAPEQFPGEAIEARQTFVYRFPGANHAFTIAADRIQPEVNIAELVLYQLAETDRVISASIELDIREAPIREWDFDIPADYSVVSVTGASVADYVSASEVANGRRNLRVLFVQEVTGRQLVNLRLEKNEPAAEVDWALPRIDFPGAKSVRGDIGIIGVPGFRVAVRKTDSLVEKPLSYFPQPTANLQQAFRIREPGWSATMQIELLDRSVQADVFHLYSLSQDTVYGSALINYFVAGAPVSEWRIAVPDTLGNVMVDGQDVRTWRREGGTLFVSLHQPVMGAYTLLVTFEEKPDSSAGTFQVGPITPVGVQGESGFIQVVSPMQVEIKTEAMSAGLLTLDPLELPAEFRLLSTAPSLGAWQYTERPFELKLKVNWFQPGSTATQVVEFSEANSQVSQDGELVTDVVYYVKARGQHALRIKLPADPVRLWEVSVGGRPVTARNADDVTLIPLPGGTDPNVPIEVRIRLAKPAVRSSKPKLTLPIVLAPVVKTQWNITGEVNRVLVPSGGTVSPAVPVLRPSGFDWVARHGLTSLLAIGLCTVIGIWTTGKSGAWRVLRLVSLAIAIGVACSTARTAWIQAGTSAPLQLSLPILSAGESVELVVNNTPLWRVDVSWWGVACLLGGFAMIGWWFTDRESWRRLGMRCGGIGMCALGLLLQRGSAPHFYAALALVILFLLFVPQAWDGLRRVSEWLRQAAERRKARKAAADSSKVSDSGAMTTSAVLLAVCALSMSRPCTAAAPDRFTAADSMVQTWQISHADARLAASATVSVSGQAGDQFLLLKAPAVLTRFEGPGLRLSKRELPGEGMVYLVSIVATEADSAADESVESASAEREYQATFDFQLEAINLAEGVPVLAGTAAVQTINVRYDEPGWEVTSPAAVRVEAVEAEGSTTQASILLAPGPATLWLKPKARDVTGEKTQFFVETSNVYIPGPGVVDGHHRLHLRTSQGQVTELNVVVPTGLTVSAVSGPIGSWQFDAETGRLKMEVEPAQSQAFDVLIDTQRGLDPLPADIKLAPLKVLDADGEVGLVGIAFGPDAQPEKTEPTTMSAVNLGDFDAELVSNQQAVLHRVYRYGSDGGELALRVAPVEPEVRVSSQQVLSLGDERVVLGVNFAADISRAGLFQLSFPLPAGYEVESLTGDALHHWSELSDGGLRQVVLHLHGKTIGVQNFSLTLTSPAPTDVADWEIPRFELNEATRQTGDLVVRPTTGIRLRTVSRQNVSETDPRSLGGGAQGALAFRILQRDWNLVLGVEKLEPWVTGQVLHEVTLREGQTRSTLLAKFHVQNASILALRVTLPNMDEDQSKTLRASGETVSDFVRTASDSNIWEVQFKRRVVGDIDFRIEFERRGDRANDSESLSPAEFPDVRQLAYYFSVRTGGRLEVEHDALSQGWQRVDWSTVPLTLREAGNHTAPTLALRATSPPNRLAIRAKRHSLADGLKLRVAEGMLTTILSPTGDQLTAVDVTIEVIQRSSLSVSLPAGGEMLSIFVNGESVHSIRQGGDAKAWQFYILPGIDDRTANVRFVYSVTGQGLSNVQLTSADLNVPLENIQWNVVAPKGFELIDSDGKLELIRQSNQGKYDRDSYLSKANHRRVEKAQEAAQLLDQANQLLQAGEQTKARWALNSVANQYALDAASNEDARVQLENLQTQQAIVGLNTRRQRLYLDNSRDDVGVTENSQIREAAAGNPILQQDAMNFRPQQLSQLLQGNTTEDNAVLQQIAGRLVQHQHTTEPAPQAIIISLPEEGNVYTFRRSVQVAEKAPLDLELQFDSQLRLHRWRAALVFALVTALAMVLTLATRGRGTGER